MAEPLPPLGTPAGGKSLLPTNPRQRRIILGLAGAAVLALIFLLSGRRGGGDVADDGQLAETMPAGDPVGSTFADNGEAAGELGTALTTGLGDVAYALEGVAAGQEAAAGEFQGIGETVLEGQSELGSSLAEISALLPTLQEPPSATAPGPLGAAGGAGTTAARIKPKVLNPRKTPSHAAAGLRRVGTRGNVYKDKRGKVYHRVGSGGKSHFAPGPPAKPKPKAKAKPRQAPRRPQTQRRNGKRRR